jgi:subfamily B ATP-binding cassette protein MsbA
MAVRVKSSEIYLRLLGFARPYWLGFLVSFLAAILIAASETAFPALMKELLERGFVLDSGIHLWMVPAAILLIFLIRGAAGFLSAYSMSWIAQHVLRDLRAAMFDKLLRLPIAKVDSHSSGKLISRIVSDVNGVTSAATNVVTTIVRDSLILISLIGWMFWINTTLTLIVLVMAPVLMTITIKFSKRLRRVNTNLITANAELTKSVEESIHGLRQIKLFGAEAYQSTSFGRVNTMFRSQSMRLAVAQSLQSPVGQLITAIGVAIIVTIGVFQAKNGLTSIAEFVSFVTAMLMLFGPVKHLADINAQLQKGLAAADAIFELLDESNEESGTQQLNNSVKGNIVFENVALTYGGRETPSLTDVSFEIPPRSFVAFVGPSGGGKSSVYSILAGLYRPSNGRITIDGFDIADLEIKELRKLLSVVSQDVFLANDTIVNNLRWGDQNASPEEIWAALTDADLASFVSSLPEGLNTNIGGRGLNLSGGQRQRLSIARALLKKAPILLFDEATSALDITAEKNIYKTLIDLRGKKTILVITHRIETVIQAEPIFLIDEGRIIASGSHSNLLEGVTEYRRLFGRL